MPVYIAKIALVKLNSMGRIFYQKQWQANSKNDDFENLFDTPVAAQISTQRAFEYDLLTSWGLSGTTINKSFATQGYPETVAFKNLKSKLERQTQAPATSFILFSTPPLIFSNDEINKLEILLKQKPANFC